MMRCLLLLLAALALRAQVVTELVDVDGTRYARLRSADFEVLVDPARGGQVVSLIHRQTGMQMGNPGGRNAGLFSDHDLKQPHPGEFMSALYEVELLPPLPDGSGRVQLTRTAVGGWRNESPPSLAGLVYTKIICLAADRPVLSCHVRIDNPTGDNRLIDYWLQNIARIGEPKEVNYYYRPTATGVMASSSECVLPDREFVTDPAAGWMAAINRRRQAGLVYLVDVNAIARLYNCNAAFTQEFMYQRLPLPPGRSWETDCAVRPLFGFDDVVYASPAIVAGMDVADGGDMLRITHSLAAFAAPLRDVRVTTSLADLASGVERTAAALTMPELGTDMRTLTVSFPHYASGLKVVRVVLEHADGVERYEMPVPALGDPTGTYRRTIPARDLSIQKPDDLEAVWRTARQDPAGVLVLGDSPTTLPWRFDAVADQLGLKSTILHFTPRAYWRDPALDPFPAAHADLFRYDVLVFTDGDARAVRYYGADMIRDYVRQGGGVLFVGGYYCFGKGAFAGSPLADLLPVALAGPWDLRPARDPQPRVAPTAYVWLGRDDLGAVRIPWYHAARPLPDATVHLTIDEGQPLLVTRPYGKGQVAAFLGTPFRDDDSGEYLDDPRWRPFAARLLDHLRARQ